MLSTIDIKATEVCQFQQDRGEQVCQFRKDWDEQARYDLERVLWMNVWIVGYIFGSFDVSTADMVALSMCQFESLMLQIANVSLARSQFDAKQARCGKLITAIQNFTILHTSYRRRNLLIAMQFVIVLHTVFGRWRLLTVMQIVDIQYTSCGRKKLLLPMPIFTIANIVISSLHLLFKVNFNHYSTRCVGA